MDHDWTDLGATLDRAWDLLSAATAARETQARLVTLATISASGPEARSVVLRSANRAAASVRIFTDSRSCKITEAQADPRASILHWNEGAAFQIRLRGNLSVQTGPEVDDDWAALNDLARLSYAGPGPGLPIGGPGPRPLAGERKAFAVLTMSVSEMDVVWLGPDLHTRAVYRETDGWAGTWLSP
ncbi:MAG: pyridoxamine 5'-phosphate oxidase family protein [Pseudomonadota bacterium]